MKIVCPSYLRNIYIENLLKDTNIISNIDLNEFDNLYFPDVTKESSLIFNYKVYDSLNKIRDSLKVYGKSMIDYPAFIEEISAFSKECSLYNIDLDSLPTNTPQQKDLKIILKEISKIDNLEKIKGNTFVNPNDTYWIDTYYDDFYTRNLFKKTNPKNVISLVNQEPKSIQYKNSLNPRTELESIAQYICLNHIEKDTLIILTDKNLINLLDQIFYRYHIPYGTNLNKETDKAYLALASLLKFYLKKDITSFIDLIIKNALRNSDEQYNNLINQYIININDEFIIPELKLNEDESLNNNDLNSFKEYYDLLISSNKEIIDILLEPINKENIISIYKHLVNLNIFDSKSLLSIRNILIDVYDYLNNEKDIERLIYFLETNKASKNNLSINNLAVTDLTHPLPSRKYSFVVGTTSINYPNIPIRSGLFNEKYINEIKDFPSFEERTNDYLNNLNWIKKSAKEILFYSIHYKDYEGKSYEWAKEILDKDTSTKWELLENNIPVLENNHSLNPEIAKELFFENDTLKGSISKFEVYFNCPYHYFLQYGLKIDEEFLDGYEANTIGTIQHKVLEESLNRYKDKYLDICKDEIEKIVDPYFEILKKIYPKKIKVASIIKEKLINNLLLSFTALKTIEKDNKYLPDKAEYEFKIYKNYDNGLIRLKGIVDRIDIDEDNIRIIDYKSSIHELKEEEIKAGKQLQLITYLMVVKELFKDKKITGAYYYSLKNENINGTNDETKDYESFISGHKLKGVSISDNANKYYSSKKANNNLLTVIDEIYELLLQRLKDGDIKIDPLEGACLYCPYASICDNYKGQREVQSILQKDIKIFEDGKDAK